jgi:toxin ParE1/3/4
MSAHKLEVRLTARARRDVENILLHTERTWGAEQTAAYDSAITRTLDLLRVHPQLGRPRDDLFSGSRSVQVEQHVIYYHHPQAAVIEVLRVLHRRQDASTLVGDPRLSE